MSYENTVNEAFYRKFIWNWFFFKELCISIKQNQLYLHLLISIFNEDTF